MYLNVDDIFIAANQVIILKYIPSYNERDKASGQPWIMALNELV